VLARVAFGHNPKVTDARLKVATMSIRAAARREPKSRSRSL
jgi:hypothetical protein